MTSSVQTGAPTARDYAPVDSLEKALRLVEAGDLVALLMMPEDFGGEARLENTIYVPAFVAQRKETFEDEVIIPLFEQGLAVNYDVRPSYRGASLVPVGVTLTAKATTSGPHSQHIAIW